jgi:ribosomal protein S7
MMNGRNNGKKLMAVRIVAHAFEIVRLQAARVSNRECGKECALGDG